MGKLPKGLADYLKNRGNKKGGKVKTPKPFMSQAEIAKGMVKKKGSKGVKPTVKAGYKPKGGKIKMLGGKRSVGTVKVYKKGKK